MTGRFDANSATEKQFLNFSMVGMSTLRGLRLFAFFCSASWIFLAAYCDDPSTQDYKTKTDDGSGILGSRTVIIGVAVVAAGLVLFFLYRLWQKKKREEQYAHLLRLFEEDDELEMELGLRD